MKVVFLNNNHNFLERIHLLTYPDDVIVCSKPTTSLVHIMPLYPWGISNIITRIFPTDTLQSFSQHFYQACIIQSKLFRLIYTLLFLKHFFKCPMCCVVQQMKTRLLGN